MSKGNRSLYPLARGSLGTEGSLLELRLTLSYSLLYLVRKNLTILVRFLGAAPRLFRSMIRYSAPSNSPQKIQITFKVLSAMPVR